MPDNLVAQKPPEMEVAVLSEAGLRRENQDWLSWSRIPWGECYIVADGMGGYKGGATASRMTVEGLERFLKEQPPELPFEKALREAMCKTNEEVHRTAHSGAPDMSRMGSTVAVALVTGNQLYVGHVGDSRIYLFRKGKLTQLTKDHTSVQRMVDAEMLTTEQARKHPDAHILSRAVGSQPNLEIEIGKPIELEPGDGILLCSDGLSGYAQDDQIRRVLSTPSDVQSLPRKLVNLALKCGSDDNITVQFIRYGKHTDTRRNTAVLAETPSADRAGTVKKWISGTPRGTLALAAAVCVIAGLFALPPVRSFVAASLSSPPPATKSKTLAPPTPLPPPAPPDRKPQVTATNPVPPPVPPPAATNRGKGQEVAKTSPKQTKASAGKGSKTSLETAAGEKKDAAPAPIAAAEAPPAETAQQPPVTPTQQPQPVRVAILVTNDADMKLAAAIENALSKAGSGFRPEIVQRQDLGHPPPKRAIFFVDGENATAMRLLHLLDQSPELKDFITRKYDGREQQYQGLIDSNPASKDLLIVFPRQAQ